MGLHTNLFTKYKDIILSNNLPVGEFDIHKKGLHFSEINILIHNFNNFYEVFCACSVRKGQVITKLCELIVGFGLVNDLAIQEKDLQAENFPCTAQYAENSFKCLDFLFNTWFDLDANDRYQGIVNVLLLCATHSQSFPWSNEKAVNASTNVLAQLLKLTNQDLCSLLCTDYQPTIFKCVLKKLRPMLLKDTWLKYPSSCYVFSWFLNHIKHPYLIDYLNDIFPPPCMFISDHRTGYHKLAILCFSHILDNIPPTMIELDGKEDVIWNLLLPFMYSAELEIIQVLSPCMLKLPSFKSQKMRQINWTYYDDALNQLIMKAEMECNKMLSYLYLSHIYSFIHVIPPFKHIKHLLGVIERSFCKDREAKCLILSLKILKIIIKSCWPRMEHHCFKILKCIAILLCELKANKFEENIKNIHEIHNECEECLTILKSVCEKKFQIIVSKYVENGKDIPGVEIFQSVLHKI